MGGVSVWHWLIYITNLAVIAAFFVACARILNRLGYSGWWVLLSIVPTANVFGLWKLSKARWPIERR